MEAAVHFPGMAWLDSIAPEDLIRQVPILLAGAAAYAAGTAGAFVLSARRFEKVDL